MAHDDGERLKRALYLTPFSRLEFELSYEPTEDALERARRTIIRSFMGFGSDGVSGKYTTGFRANSNRSGTTPAHDWKNYAELFDGLVERLRGVVVENRDAREVMAAHDSPDTLHYVDPPYVHSTRTKPDVHGYRHEMTDADHEDLAQALKCLRGFVVVSGYDSPLYARLYAGWERVEKSALADGALKRTEILWLSPTIKRMARLI